MVCGRHCLFTPVSRKMRNPALKVRTTPSPAHSSWVVGRLTTLLVLQQLSSALTLTSASPNGHHITSDNATNGLHLAHLTHSNQNGVGGNGQEDKWSGLSSQQQSIILFAYFAGAVPADIGLCDRLDNCPPSTRCDETWKLCVPKESPHFPKTDGTCVADGECKPMYRCGGGKCLLTGPIACKSPADCLDIPDQHFTCVERPLQVPGKKCWRKCTTTRDCLDCAPLTATQDEYATCRVPAAFIHTIVCLDNFCSKNITQSPT